MASGPVARKTGRVSRVCSADHCADDLQYILAIIPSFKTGFCWVDFGFWCTQWGYFICRLISFILTKIYCKFQTYYLKILVVWYFIITCDKLCTLCCWTWAVSRIPSVSWLVQLANKKQSLTSVLLWKNDQVQTFKKPKSFYQSLSPESALNCSSLGANYSLFVESGFGLA